jgi:hypothetical protein
MRYNHPDQHEFDVPTANDHAVRTLRSLRTHGAAPLASASAPPAWETQRERRLARRPIMSRTLNGC